jgi:UDP-glucose 4-epimerase
LNITITGGAGFIGRWITKKLLINHNINIVDDFSNTTTKNIDEFKNNKKLKVYRTNLLNTDHIKKSLENSDLCIHLAAKINVQNSLDNPLNHIDNNYIGTFRLLEECRKQNTKLIIFGTCMVYDLSSNKAINEKHPVLPKSPYAATKLAAEELALSYHYSYGLPVSIVRVFNTYGPFQKSDNEGGVVSVFIKRYLENKKIQIYGSGTQTRDLLYVEDCAEFVEKVIRKAPFCGEVFNAGSGMDVSINELARTICPDETQIEHVPHIHPQSEIMKLLCDYSKAKRELNWEPSISLKVGIEKTIDWMRSTS